MRESEEALPSFDSAFKALTDSCPFLWQRRLFRRLVDGDIPYCCDLPTGLGKTSVMTIWLIARAFNPELPRRLVYVVDRRVVVDQATAVAEELRRRLKEDLDLASFAQNFGLHPEDGLPISTIRGQHVDNRLIEASLTAGHHLAASHPFRGLIEASTPPAVGGEDRLAFRGLRAAASLKAARSRFVAGSRSTKRFLEPQPKR